MARVFNFHMQIKKEPNLLKKLKSPKGCCHFGDIIVAKYGVMTP